MKLFDLTRRASSGVASALRVWPAVPAPVSALVATLAALAVMPASAQADATALLRQADALRGGATHMQLETEVLLLDAAGKPEKTRSYTVFARDPLNSLVLMRTPAEDGQKLLMSSDDFWLLMPDSQRPLRVTPAQKLLGEASAGDIASLAWAESYGGQVVGEESCAVGQARKPCLHLSLNALRKGVSYQRIELWLGAQHKEPLKADYYVLSDKLAKRAAFVFNDANAPRELMEIRLRDELAAGKETVVRYLGRKKRSVPESWFNPMYLVRNVALE